MKTSKQNPKKLNYPTKQKNPQIERVPCYLPSMSPFKYDKVEATSSLDCQKWGENLSTTVLGKYNFIPLISIFYQYISDTIDKRVG